MSVESSRTKIGIGESGEYHYVGVQPPLSAAEKAIIMHLEEIGQDFTIEHDTTEASMIRVNDLPTSPDEDLRQALTIARAIKSVLALTRAPAAVDLDPTTVELIGSNSSPFNPRSER
jgi:hypothetical protein